MKNFCLTQTSEGKKGMRLSMEYITNGDAVQKWNISERRIRKLLTKGRAASLIMKLDLMKNGYNPTIIKNRLDYYEALDKAHNVRNYKDFVRLINKLNC